MISRNYLALEIAPSELRAISLRRKGAATRLAGARMLALPPRQVIPSLRECNLADPQQMADSIREVLDPLAGREDRVALSLPNGAGRVFLTEMETPFKSRAEGIEILKWQLKSSLPIPLQEIRLDYQVLPRNEQGRQNLIVAIMAGKILCQYEDVVAAAGYGAAQVDFHCHNLYNYYRPRLDLGENFILLAIEDGVLSLQYFQGKLLAYHRTREVEPEPAAVYQELNRTLVNCESNFPSFAQATVNVHCNWGDNPELMQALESAFARRTVLLQPHLEKLYSPADGKVAAGMQDLAAAVGAAERMF